MGIKFTCPQCGKGLNVKANLAGRRGLCPHCKGRVEIPPSEEAVPVAPIAPQVPSRPLASTTFETPAPRATSSKLTPPSAGKTAETRSTAGSSVKAFEDLDPNSFLLDRPHVDLTPTPQTHFDWIADAPEAVWYVRNRAGGQYGPAVGTMMRTWLQEGRVSRECHVWREGWAHWRQANDVFPHWFEPRINGQQPVLPAPSANARVPIGRAISTSATSNASQRSGPVGPGTATIPATEMQPTLPSPARRHNATWLFIAILTFVLTFSCVAITTVVYMIKKASEVRPPNQSAPAEEIRDPFAEANRE